MTPDRTIGRTVRVKTYQALVELAVDTSSYVKSSYGGLYAIAVINSFVIIPVGSERVVAVVTALDMAEDAEASLRHQQMLIIARPRRTMWVSMIGTITQSVNGQEFEYGVRRYPELDNPVWFASEEDLDIIFNKANAADQQHVSIGKSPIFTDYAVSIDIDRFFGKHAAILGNTGAGKSCTVTALIKAVLDRGMPNAHFVIFDTNNEYERAFTRQDGKPIYQRLILRNEGETPTGLWVPHWFMNSMDYHAFFRPGEGAQAPLLFNAIMSARSRTQRRSAILNFLQMLDETCSAIDQVVGNGKVWWKGTEGIIQNAVGLSKLLDEQEELFTAIDLAESRGEYIRLAQAISGEARKTPSKKELTAASAAVLAGLLGEFRRQLALDTTALSRSTDPLVGVDSPVHFDFDEFVDRTFEETLEREAQRDPKIRTYVGTLQLRLQQARQDPRYRFLFGPRPFAYALASFLRLIVGVEPDRNFEEGSPPWREAYEEQYPEDSRSHQITILDFSQLASEVLENVTALIGRLILEFMQRIPMRGEFPIVLILEEAHNYIPANARLERQQCAREVFEKIAKEGRKFGLSLVVASQRPSELSRTVLAQCNRFIVHRIQNPDDQEYFKSVISGINREILDQLPALAQQHAIVLGDCVTLPLQVRINTVSPRPRSEDPPFVRQWTRSDLTIPDFEDIARKWEGADGGEEEE